MVEALSEAASVAFEAELWPLTANLLDRGASAYAVAAAASAQGTRIAITGLTTVLSSDDGAIAAAHENCAVAGKPLPVSV